MSNFNSIKLGLNAVLEQIVQGKIQLPDFQRGWVWDDEHIKSLLISIARAFPIGSIMLLETGGTARFQIRPVEGVNPHSANSNVERLILDGQQRLTSLVQVLKLTKPVRTRDAQKRDVERFYYIDIEKALQGNGGIEEAFISLDRNRQLKKNFGREVTLDLSTSEKEFDAFFFPCNQILNSDQWEEGLMAYDQNRFARYMKFRSEVLNRFRNYDIPIIELLKENSKEAVCLIFEKVNTGGVSLSVFELVTASYAAEGFNLRDDWYGSRERNIKSRKHRMTSKPLLSGIEPSDFLQGISLLYTYERRQQDVQAGRAGKEVTAVSAKREQILAMPLSAYQTWADRLTDGFLVAEEFLRREGFQKIQFLPYQSQVIPLAAVMVHLGDRWLEPVIQDKLVKWFWSGVFGELYGGAIETRLALDVQDLLAWIFKPDAHEPTTVVAAGFQPSRLDTLRTRTSAAYRGLYTLLQREGSKDFFWKIDMKALDHNEYSIDIHHIFPQAWCKARGIPPRVFNSIVNKTPISYKANGTIGGKAPSVYLAQLRDHKHVQISVDEQNEILRTHLIEPEYLHRDDFDGFYQHRKQQLIELIEKAMGKVVITALDEEPVSDETDEEEDHIQT
jgi:hypothetical protein